MPVYVQTNTTKLKKLQLLRVKGFTPGDDSGAEAMEVGREWFNRLWRNPVGTTLFYGSLLLHFLLALYALYRRRNRYGHTRS